jgi:hypothetical protein
MLRSVDESAITPAMALLPVGMDSPRARVQMLCIGLQESGLTHRVQIGGGPARGLLQFERGGGVRGVLTNHSTINPSSRVCAARKVAPTMQKVWEALETDDVLAFAFGRLLLWTDPYKLPSDAKGGWDLYVRTWRPGKPHADTWQAFYKRAEDWVLRGIDS